MMNQARGPGQRVRSPARMRCCKLHGMSGRRTAEDIVAPRLPVRASIYIAPDGTVHFGALFAELVSVAAALSTAGAARTLSTAPAESTSISDVNAIPGR
jgi:hypothetical protein